MEVRVAALSAETRCRRCQLEPPPLERWPGDPRSRDCRPAHSCGLAKWLR